MPHWIEVDEKTPTTVLIRYWKELEDALNAPPPDERLDRLDWKCAKDRARLFMGPVLQEMKRRGFPVVGGDE